MRSATATARLGGVRCAVRRDALPGMAQYDRARSYDRAQYETVVVVALCGVICGMIHTGRWF
jgi:hypothetical protein